MFKAVFCICSILLLQSCDTKLNKDELGKLTNISNTTETNIKKAKTIKLDFVLFKFEKQNSVTVFLGDYQINLSLEEKKLLPKMILELKKISSEISKIPEGNINLVEGFGIGKINSTIFIKLDTRYFKLIEIKEQEKYFFEEILDKKDLNDLINKFKSKKTNINIS